ncbi:ABC transporter permease [Blastococcus sp. MG754426]|uniref:ABC transporter permease n=1 Tax=unclassified Blastococcus TaxID=2619396 RepID=UPI001EF046EF|nr:MULTISPECIES: ABC transporter permease [unclassified Blastococcus]MCF6506196.1 ABC transporter permease [Blastococcus sp. MG754426]MCF6510426.1 ABC transporter permease [Blastococcus sp. MG754427]MCF6737643.1 ABC transporter permease [Blastococcus sp. KM273129]
MGSSVVDVDLRLGAVLVALTALAAVSGRVSGLGEDRPVLVAAARATAQLTVVSALLLVVVRSLWLSAAFVLLMVSVATATAAGRATGRPLRSPGAVARLAAIAVPVVGGAAPVVALVLASGTVPLRGEAVIPIAGILIGGAMTATSLAGRRLREELAQRRGEVEAALAVGLLPRDAVLLVGRPVAGTALVPPLDQTRTVGLVTLPGAFVGVLLGGGSPLEAGAAQLLVLVGLLAAEVLAVWAVTELVARGRVLPVPR